MENFLKKNYASRSRGEGLNEELLAVMNEERRKRKGLPPLTPIDYNCIDRAAIKLKFILECLFLKR